MGFQNGKYGSQKSLLGAESSYEELIAGGFVCVNMKTEKIVVQSCGS